MKKDNYIPIEKIVAIVVDELNKPNKPKVVDVEAIVITEPYTHAGEPVTLTLDVEIVPDTSHNP